MTIVYFQSELLFADRKYFYSCILLSISPSIFSLVLKNCTAECDYGHTSIHGVKQSSDE